MRHDLGEIFHRPAIGLLRVRVYAVANELRAAADELERVHGDFGERLGHPVDRRPLGRSADPLGRRLAQLEERLAAQLLADVGVEHIQVHTAEAAGGHADPAAGPFFPDVQLERFGQPVTVPGPVRVCLPPGRLPPLAGAFGTGNDRDNRIAHLDQGGAMPRHPVGCHLGRPTTIGCVHDEHRVRHVGRGNLLAHLGRCLGQVRCDLTKPIDIAGDDHLNEGAPFLGRHRGKVRLTQGIEVQARLLTAVGNGFVLVFSWIDHLYRHV